MMMDPLVVELDTSSGTLKIEVSDDMQIQEVVLDKGDKIRFPNYVLTVHEPGVYRVHGRGVLQVGREGDRRFGQPHFGHEG